MFNTYAASDVTSSIWERSFLKAIQTKGVKQQAVIKRSVEDTFQPGIENRVKKL